MHRRDFLKGVAEVAPLLVAEIPIGLLWGTLAVVGVAMSASFVAFARLRSRQR